MMRVSRSTYFGIGGCLNTSRCSCSLIGARLPGTVHVASRGTPLRFSSAALNRGLKLHGRVSAATFLTTLAHDDDESPAPSRRQSTRTLRRRLQSNGPSHPPSVASPPPPPATGTAAQSMPQQHLQQLPRTRNNDLGITSSIPSRPFRSSFSSFSCSRTSHADEAGDKGAKSSLSSAAKLLTPATQGRQMHQHGRGAAGTNTQPLQPHHTNFELKTGLALTWLGTNSGAPTVERNVSCTLLRLPGAVQIVDCGEGTHRQLLALEGSVDLSEVDGIFITHLHGDHCFGVAAALAVLDRAKAAGQTDPARRRHHVYGPPGLAELVRVSMISTGMTRRLELPILVSELVTSPAAAHPPQPLLQALGQNHQYQQQQQQQLLQRWRRHSHGGADDGGLMEGGHNGGGVQVLLQRVAAQRLQDAPDLTAAVQAVQPRVAGLEEIWCPPRYPPSGHYGGRYGRTDGRLYSGSENESELSSSADEDFEGGGDKGGGAPFRQLFIATEGLFWELPGCAGVKVRAAQLQHRVPCWGYVFVESTPYEEGMRRRKVVVLGDTVSSKPIAPLAAGCDVISHEATFARGMEAKARIAQHSTGWMAGAFAAAVGARSLVLTHFSARYREGPKEIDLGRSSRSAGLQEMEQQSWAVAGLLKEAAATYGRPQHLFAATDFYTHHVAPRPLAAAAGNRAGADRRDSAEAAAAAAAAKTTASRYRGDGGNTNGASDVVGKARLLRTRAAV